MPKRMISHRGLWHQNWGLLKWATELWSTVGYHENVSSHLTPPHSSCRQLSFLRFWDNYLEMNAAVEIDIKRWNTKFRIACSFFSTWFETFVFSEGKGVVCLSEKGDPALVMRSDGTSLYLTRQVPFCLIVECRGSPSVCCCAPGRCQTQTGHRGIPSLFLYWANAGGGVAAPPASLCSCTSASRHSSCSATAAPAQGSCMLKKVWEPLV